MAKIRSICVYCGSRPGTDPGFVAGARDLGRRIGEAGIDLVYGGGRVGLMGVVADAALAAGGRVIGIIPRHLEAIEVGHRALTELIVVPSMHIRKQIMFERSDAFVVLPGGIGSLDETFEIMTWRQLKLHDKPIVVINHQDYWRPFLTLVDHLVAADFAQAGVRDLFTVVDHPADVLPALTALPDPVSPAQPEKL
jgi:uncharacterized protein (TIGR00730 family)